MWDLATELVPELIGLAITPAAVIACLLLLGSSHPLRNVAALAGVFLLVYAALGAVVLVVGSAADVPTDDADTTRGWASLVVGTLFLAGGLVSWLRAGEGAVVPEPRVAVVDALRPAAAGVSRGPSVARDGRPEPGWVARLRDPSLRLVLVAGLVLAVLNPNVAILCSGLGVVLTADVGGGTRVAGVALLLLASLLDFAVPTLAFVVAGERGRHRLRLATRWLIAHNHAIGIGVLLAFGLLFVGRGLARLVG